MIQRETLDTYTKLINALSDDCKKLVEEKLLEISLDNVALARDAVIVLLETYLSQYTDAAAVVAAEFYDGCREIANLKSTYTAQSVSGRVPQATDMAVRGMIQSVVDGKPNVFYENVLGRVDYEIKRSAGDCIFINGEKDKAKVRYARVPTGYDTCNFCLMLASRGAVYKSAMKAGELNHYHANCDCRVVPVFNDEYIEGYNPDELYEKWIETQN